MFDRNINWTYSKYFLYYLLLSLFAAKSVNAKNIYIESIKSSCTRNTYINNTCARVTYARNIFSIIGTCIKIAGLDDIYIEDASRRNACTRGVYTIKYSRIYL